MRRLAISTGEFYHIFNRGIDKRNVFLSSGDFERFLTSMMEFNIVEPIGSIYEHTFHKDKRTTQKRKHLVNIICYCLNPNHFHFILEQVVDRGIEKFMHRLGLGYTKYFNQKYKRGGHLFQGPFKALHVDSNEYLLHVSAYVNLNNEVHRLGNRVSKSSWNEYIKHGVDGVCKKDIILKQFKNVREYRKFTEESLQTILEKKELAKELATLLIE